MKYTIHGLQQDKLIKLGLTHDDSLILSVLKDRYSSMNMEYKILDNQRFIWINHENFLRDIPIIFNTDNIDSSKRKLLNVLKKYENLGLIIRKTEYTKFNSKKNKIERGTYSYFCISSKFDFLTDYEKTTLNTEENIGYEKKFVGGTKKNSQGVRKIFRNKDSPTIDSFIIDNTSSSKTDDVHKTNIKLISKQDIEYLNVYRENFKEKYKATLAKNYTEELFIRTGKENLEFYLENYQKFLDTATKEIKDIGRFFNYVVTNKIPLPISKIVNNRPIQALNYEQRNYPDEYFDGLYDNFTADEIILLLDKLITTWDFYIMTKGSMKRQKSIS
jgi:hypothetical protein